MKVNLPSPQPQAAPVTVARIIREWAEADDTPADLQLLDRVILDAARRTRERVP